MTYHKQPKRKGAVLITVMVVIVVLLLIGYQYLNLMLAEGNASIVSGRLAQARHLADSGVHFANFVLAFPQTQNLSDTPESYHPWYGNIYDNSDIFHYRPINGPNGVKGYFSIVSPRDPLDTTSSTGYRFGVEDEGGKINLNAMRALIKQRPDLESLIDTLIRSIPNMNEEQALAVKNWTKEGGTPDSGESAYYSSLGYQSKAGPYDSLDELLMVKGWTPKQLYGNDKNRNGKLDPDEDDGSGQVDLGYQRFFTVYSRELNVDSTGQQRINLAGKTASDLKTQLDAAGFSPEMTAYLLLVCAGNKKQASRLQVQAELLTSGPSLAMLPNGFAYVGGKLTVSNISAVTLKYNFTQTKTTLWDFIDNGLAYQYPGPPRGRTGFYCPIQTTMNLDELRTILNLFFDKCSTTADYEIPARININTCPADVLTALGINPSDTEKLIEMRPSPDMDPSVIPYYRTPAWLITEAKLSPTVVGIFSNFITTYSQVYRFQVVGYYEFRGPQVRLEVVVDANNGRPRILYWRDLTDLGKGYNFSQNRGGQ